MCCRVDRCCFCFEHVLGVKVLGVLLILVELAIIIVSTLYLPHFLFAIVPTSSIGIFCDIFLLVAVFRASRWFLLPWLIYIMILIVGLSLAAVLHIVISLGAVRDPNWLVVILWSVGCLVVAAILLYFWIVVLELFIRLGPPMPDQFDGGAMVYGPAAGGAYPPVAAATPAPMAAYPAYQVQQQGYPPQGYFQGYPPSQQGPPSIIYQTGPPHPQTMMR